MKLTCASISVHIKAQNSVHVWITNIIQVYISVKGHSILGCLTSIFLSKKNWLSQTMQLQVIFRTWKGCAVCVYTGIMNLIFGQDVSINFYVRGYSELNYTILYITLTSWLLRVPEQQVERWEFLNSKLELKDNFKFLDFIV